ncbi:ComEC/Rec2 family competence protein [Sinomonas halotolerans]|uniref:ComEC/Rec2 family competence protein n=1 Tax=Sinomonas halotolerans TaxID=1644133 RepID=A0ABU9X0T3_9MICC
MSAGKAQNERAGDARARKVHAEEAPAGSSRGRTAWDRYRAAAARDVPAGTPSPAQAPAALARAWAGSLWSVPDTPGPVRASRWRDLRLVPLAAAAWAGAALGPPAAAWAAKAAGVPPSDGARLVLAAAGALAVSGAALIAVALLRRAARTLRPGLLLGTAVLAALAWGLAASASHWASEVAGPAGTLLSEGGQTRAVVDVMDDPRPQRLAGPYARGPRFLVEARMVRAADRGLEYAARARVLLAGGPEVGRLRPGQRLLVSGEAVPPNAPGGRVLISLSASPRVLERGAGPTAAAGDARAALRAASSWLAADAAGLVPGMAAGDTGALSADLESAMRTAGLGHLTAVSGANFTILLGTVLLIARSLRAPRWLALAACATALAAFVATVGAEASVARAASMGAVGLVALSTGRASRSCSALAAAVLAVIALDPPLAASMGMLLSVAATLGIALLGPPIAEALARRLPPWLALAIAVPLSAQLLCGPLLVAIQPAFLTYSLAANMLSAPFVAPVTVAGTLALAFAAWCPPVAMAASAVAGAAAHPIAAIARLAAGAPGAMLPWPEGAAGMGSMAACSAVNALLLWTALVPAGRAWAAMAVHAIAAALSGGKRAGGRGGSIGPGSPRGGALSDWGRGPGRRAVAAGAVLLLAAALAVAVRSAVSAVSLRDWHVTMCDVGQGDGIVLSAGQGAAVVVDSGKDPALMDACLDGLGVRTVEAYAITHFHADHYGGTAGVFEGRMVRRVLVSAAAGRPPAALRDVLERSGTSVESAAAGSAGTAGSANWTVLWPPARPGSGQRAADPDEQNGASLVLRIGWAGLRGQPLLLTGDLEEDGAARLLAREPSLVRDPPAALKLAHHGARNGGTAIVRALDPPVALISSGRGNDYGHPHAEILDALAAQGSEVLRTDLSGRIQLRFAEGSVEWSSG